MGLRLPNGQTDAGASGKTVLTADANGNIIAQPYGGSAKTLTGNILNSICDGRLTLTSGLPVLTADVTAATTVYYTPYKGNQTALYYGGAWGVYSFAEHSISLSGATSGNNYDFFEYWTGTAVALEKLAWTSSTARATALAYQDGVLVKSGDPTRKYVGNAYMSATGQTECVFSSTSRAPALSLWNYYNRVNVSMSRRESATSWTDATVAWRQANASSNNQCNFVIGWIEEDVLATYMCFAVSPGTITAQIAIGFNSITSPIGSAFQFSNSTTIQASGFTNLSSKPAVGLNYVSAMETISGAGTFTFYGISSLMNLTANLRY